MNAMLPSSTTHALVTALQLGQQLKSARQQRRLTQAEVSAKVGLSQNRLSHLERHAEQLSVQQLLAWCAAVGLELSIAERAVAPPSLDASDPSTSEW